MPEPTRADQGLERVGATCCARTADEHTAVLACRRWRGPRRVVVVSRSRACEDGTAPTSVADRRGSPRAGQRLLQPGSTLDRDGLLRWPRDGAPQTWGRTSSVPGPPAWQGMGHERIADGLPRPRSDLSAAMARLDRPAFDEQPAAAATGHSRWTIRHSERAADAGVGPCTHRSP